MIRYGEIVFSFVLYQAFSAVIQASCVHRSISESQPRLFMGELC